MKAPLAKLRPDLIETTRAALETLAAGLLDREKVRGAMLAAARDGFAFCTVKVPRPVDLRHTSAAAELLTWLAGERLEARWSERGDVGEAAALGGAGFELVISWGTTAGA